ncbi:MAG: flavodoxin domain-containing protein [Chloroflexota bacterium]
MPKKVLVAYASRAGSTAEVAAAIGEALCAAGLAAEVRNVKRVPDLRGYDAVVLGSAIRMGRPLGEATRFARRNAAALAQMPVALFSVCAALQEDTPANCDKAREQTAPLTQALPAALVAQFAGKIDLATLPWLLRVMLRKAGESEDLKLGDYRDWNGIRAWAGEVAAKFGV